MQKELKTHSEGFIFTYEDKRYKIKALNNRILLYLGTDIEANLTIEFQQSESKVVIMKWDSNEGRRTCADTIPQEDIVILKAGLRFIKQPRRMNSKFYMVEACLSKEEKFVQIRIKTTQEHIEKNIKYHIEQLVWSLNKAKEMYPEREIIIEVDSDSDSKSKVTTYLKYLVPELYTVGLPDSEIRLVSDFIKRLAESNEATLKPIPNSA